MTDYKAASREYYNSISLLFGGKPRVYIDLHKRVSESEVSLNTLGSFWDLEAHGIMLSEGLYLYFWTDDADDNGNDDPILSEGAVHFDTSQNCWIATIDWDRLVHASDLVASASNITP
jgi:hypothetical protein